MWYITYFTQYLRSTHDLTQHNLGFLPCSGVSKMGTFPELMDLQVKLEKQTLIKNDSDE